MFKMKPEGELYFENGVHLGSVLQDVDGYYKWWPNEVRGFLDQDFLKAIATFLYNLNLEWDTLVQREIGGSDDSPSR